jgi:hypothetical protein
MHALGFDPQHSQPHTDRSLNITARQPWALRSNPPATKIICAAGSSYRRVIVKTVRFRCFKMRAKIDTTRAKPLEMLKVK